MSAAAESQAAPAQGVNRTSVDGSQPKDTSEVAPTRPSTDKDLSTPDPTSAADEDSSLDDAIAEPPLERGLEFPGSISSHSQPRPLRTPALSRHTVLLLQLATYSLLAFITVWGVLARLGLEWLGGFAEEQVFRVIWPQVAGCAVMGFVVGRKKGLERVYPPLFVALGTGFCGSLTTFSSWMYDVFVAFAQLDAVAPNRFSGFLSGLAVTLVTISLSTTALTLGAQLSSFLPSSPPTSSRTPRHPPNLHHHPPSYHVLSLLLGPLSLLASLLLFFLAPPSWRPRATFAILLGPPGTLLRYELSRRLNRIYSALPLGTLAANTLATLIFALTALFMRRTGTGATSCAALWGMQDGFCGSLSTVSTFVVELRGLGRRESWRYAGVSWALGQAVMLLVLGSWAWSGDRGEVCTV